jgi:energy-coupling factor transporter ATP-binding protein EcfA2
MVRLRDRAILILDEPEVNLHPEKQHDLIRLLREHHEGSVVVATHSVELMNNVSVSHIIHVEKEKPAPKIKSVADRGFLELVRSAIGSNFNLVASQFDEVELVLFTEDRSDYDILEQMLESTGVIPKVLNIPIHGFQEYRKAKHYRDAYELLIGCGRAKYVLVLDRDYYPETYLNRIREELNAVDIRVVYTPGKEIENLFLSPEVLRQFVLPGKIGRWTEFENSLYLDEYADSFASAIKLHTEFTDGPEDTKTIAKRITTQFASQWSNLDSRHLLIGGKRALKRIREFMQKEMRVTLTQQKLLDAERRVRRSQVTVFLGTIVNHT